MIHFFDISIAERYGMPAAVIFHNLIYWTEKNKADELNYHDGRYWVYCSQQTLTKLFPYLTQNQIRYALQRLVDDGLVTKSNYNKSAMNRTVWYALTDKGNAILQNCQIDLTNFTNREEREEKEKKVTKKENKEEKALSLSEAPHARTHEGNAICENSQMRYVKIHKSICENSQIDVGNFTNQENSKKENSKKEKEENKESTNNIINTISSFSSEPRERTHARKPTLEEVKEYAEEIKATTKPEDFFNACERREWKSGNGDQITDWKAFFRAWNEKDKNRPIRRGAYRHNTAKDIDFELEEFFNLALKRGTI